MSLQVKQLDPGFQVTGHKAGFSVSRIVLKAHPAMLLALVLIIIPTLNGVTLIA